MNRSSSAAIDLAALRAPLPFTAVLRAYLMEAKFETLAALRTASFALPFVLVPLAVYWLFGVVISGNAGKGGLGPELHNYLFCGFCVMAVAMPGIFCSVILAAEREGNLLKLKRAMPMPPGASIIAKVVMSMGVAGIALALVVISGLIAGKITLSGAQVAIISLVLWLGTIPFCAIGLWIGALSSAAAAPAYGNLVFLPMIWLSGLFIPLPGALEKWVIIWPAFHLNQLALGLAGVKKYTFIAPSIAAAALLAVTVICGGLAMRRLARVG